jgi:hypothetical protein
MKANNILRTMVAALLIAAGLQTAEAQGIRVHYKNGNTMDIPAALFDRMSPGYSKTTINDDDDPEDPDIDVKVEPLNPMVASNAVAALQAAGMPIHIGINPPELSGAYSMKSLQLVAWQSQYPDDVIEQEDMDPEVVFKFGNRSGYNINVDMYEIDSDGPQTNWGSDFDNNGIDAYIVGTGNKFTVAFLIKLRWSGEWEYTGFLISGEISGNSIKDMYYCEAELDKNYNLLGYIIVKDADGASPSTTWAPGKDSSRKAMRSPKQRRGVAKRATTEKEEYFYTIYKTDGTELKVTQDELDYVETYEAEFDERITQQIPEEYLSKMATHMPIYAGNTPPIIEGAYIIHPYEMIFASDGYQPNGKFADLYMKLSDQNFTKNTIQYQDKQASQVGDKTEMVVLGQGNNFTIFAVVSGVRTDVNANYKMATIASGTMTEEGIKNCYHAILMVEKNDPNNKLMKVGTYRIFNDGDGLAIPTTWSSRSMIPQQSGGGNLSNMAVE